MDEIEVTQFILAVEEEGGRERHAKQVAKMLNAPIDVIMDGTEQ